MARGRKKQVAPETAAEVESPVVYGAPVEETVGAIEPNEEVIPGTEETKREREASEGVKSLVMSTVSVSVISDSSIKDVDHSLVSVRIQYPDDYEGKKYFRDGDIKQVAPETAQQFIEKNIATRVD